MTVAIKCCNGCVPPKRNPWCHGTCPEYADEKAQNDMEKAAANRKKEIECGLIAQTLKGVDRAYKARKHKKGN